MAAKKKAKVSRSSKNKDLSSTEGAPQKTDLIGIDDAIELLQSTRSTLYRWIAQGQIKGIKVGRQWRFEREEIMRFLRGETPTLEVGHSVTQAFDRLTEFNPTLGSLTEVLDGLNEREDDLLSKLVAAMIQTCLDIQASDIHLECHASGGRLRYRVDGVLTTASDFDSALMNPLIQKWKALFKGNVQERQKPQDGRILFNVRNQPVDLRISVFPSLYGESMVARIIEKENNGVSLEEIPLSPKNRKTLLRALSANFGQIIFTGPTGSGKTTHAYACLQHINHPGVKLITVEDPVVMPIEGAVQGAVRAELGLTFPVLLRSLLRQAPNIIYVSETRDNDTAHLCAEVALNGHIVITTLHTNSTAAALRRLVDMGVPPFVVTDSTRFVIAQRLVRALCPACATYTAITPDEVVRITRQVELLGGSAIEIPEKMPHAVGCPKCKNMGYRGRLPIVEIMEITPEIGNGLAKDASIEEIQRIAVSQGMDTLAADSLRLIREGKTTLDEVSRVLSLGILATETLSFTDRVVTKIGATVGETIDLPHIPTDDKETYRMIAAGDLKGVYECESEKLVEHLVRLQPSEFSQLIAAFAIFRPGPMREGIVETYIRLKNGDEAPTYLSPAMEPLLQETYGLLLYQEQAQAITHDLAGFNSSAYNELRQAIGKQDTKALQRIKQAFCQKAKDNINPATAEKIFAQLVATQSYGLFSREHAANHAFLLYQTAWLKCHYPEAFRHVLSTQGSET